MPHLNWHLHPLERRAVTLSARFIIKTAANLRLDPLHRGTPTFEPSNLRICDNYRNVLVIAQLGFRRSHPLSIRALPTPSQPLVLPSYTDPRACPSTSGPILLRWRYGNHRSTEYGGETLAQSNSRKVRCKGICRGHCLRICLLPT